MHVLPKGFHRIRHYHLYLNCLRSLAAIDPRNDSRTEKPGAQPGSSR